VADAAVAENSKSTDLLLFQLKGSQNPNAVRKNHSVA